jgi:hypothetical protein
MSRLITYTIFFFTSIAVITYTLFSFFIHQEAVRTELQINEACKTYLDTVTDKGAITNHDYMIFLDDLGKAGGGFEISMTVNRLYAVPDDDLGYTNEYLPAYAFSSDTPVTDADVVPAAAVIGNSTRFPAGTAVDDAQYLRKFDVVRLVVKQTSMMKWQVNVLRQMGISNSLREWSFARGCRDSGSTQVKNEPPPIPYVGY